MHRTFPAFTQWTFLERCRNSCQYGLASHKISKYSTYDKINKIMYCVYLSHCMKAHLPGLWSMLAKSSRWGLSWFKLAGSPVRCRTIVSSWTLFAKDSGDWSLKEDTGKKSEKHLDLHFKTWHWYGFFKKIYEYKEINKKKTMINCIGYNFFSSECLEKIQFKTIHYRCHMLHINTLRCSELRYSLFIWIVKEFVNMNNPCLSQQHLLYQ